MSRKNKVQMVVEDFETQFGNLVQEYLGDVDMEKAVECFQSDNLFEAVCDVFASCESEEVEEDGKTQ
jgi:hypothetical protein